MTVGFTGPSGLGRVHTSLVEHLAAELDIYVASCDAVRRIKGALDCRSVKPGENESILFDDLLNRVRPDFTLIQGSQLTNEAEMPEYCHKCSAKAFRYLVWEGEGPGRDFTNILNEYDQVIVPTQWQSDQLNKYGLKRRAIVIPHGVDIFEFRPDDRGESRRRMKLSTDDYVVGCVNFNQPRKRLDLMVEYFAEWARDLPPNVILYYHGHHGRTQDDPGMEPRYDIEELAEHYGVADRLRMTDYANPRGNLRHIYSSFDVQISTSIGEAWGMTASEGMAMGVPQILPDHTAQGEWARPAAHLVRCSTNQAFALAAALMLGKVPDKQPFVEALDRVYRDADYRADLRRRGLELVIQPRFRWENIAAEFARVFKARQIDSLAP